MRLSNAAECSPSRHRESRGKRDKLALFLYRVKRLASEEEDSQSQNALLPVVEPQLKYVHHRCCPACLDHVRPMKRDQHRGQNPLMIPLLHGFRRMTARRRVDRKVRITWYISKGITA